jgi:hypothetical protein
MLGCHRQWEAPLFGFLSVHYCLLSASFVSHRSSHPSPPGPPTPPTQLVLFLAGEVFCFQYSIYKKIKEESQWIANFVQWCEFGQLLFESFPSVITSSPLLPVNERDRDRGTKIIRLPSTLPSLSSLLSSVTKLCVTWNSVTSFCLQKSKSYRQADGNHTESSPKHAGVKRPEREAHFLLHSSVEG